MVVFLYMYHRKDHTHFSHCSELNRDQVAQFLQACIHSNTPHTYILVNQANFLFGPLINLDRPIVDFLVLSILCCIT